jgi:hypothetical protein
LRQWNEIRLPWTSEVSNGLQHEKKIKKNLDTPQAHLPHIDSEVAVEGNYPRISVSTRMGDDGVVNQIRPKNQRSITSLMTSKSINPKHQIDTSMIM